jgi:hypothetical protein
LREAHFVRVLVRRQRRAKEFPFPPRTGQGDGAGGCMGTEALLHAAHGSWIGKRGQLKSFRIGWSYIGLELLLELTNNNKTLVGSQTQTTSAHTIFSDYGLVRLVGLELCCY